MIVIKRFNFLAGFLVIMLCLVSFVQVGHASNEEKYNLTDAEINMLKQYYTSEKIKEVEELNETILKEVEITTASQYTNNSNGIVPYAGSYNGIVAQSGDILVARDNQSTRKPNQWVGHAGIVVNGGSSVAEFPGIGMVPRMVPLAQFFKENSEVFVLRHNNYNSSIKAAQWANQFLSNYPNAKYEITFDRYSLTPNYCSKFVWQAYYFGANETVAPFFAFQPLLPMELVWYNSGNTQITYVQ